jgi:hypothetical protein
MPNRLVSGIVLCCLMAAGSAGAMPVGPGISPPSWIQRAAVRLDEQEEAQVMRACKRTTTDGDVESFCGCFAGSMENDMSPEDYRAYRADVAAHRAFAGALKTKITAMLEECRSVTTGAH